MSQGLKLLILALDGATPGFIDKHRAELPHFQSLMRRGTWGVVAGPPFSYDRWFSYYTGLRPDQHGMEALRLSQAGRVSYTMSKAKQFLWDYVTRAGLRFGMLGGLGTDPPAPVPGFWANFYYDAFHPKEAQPLCTNLWVPEFPNPVCPEIGTKPWEQVSPALVLHTLALYDWNLLIGWAMQRQHRQRVMLHNLMAKWPVDVLWYYAFELDWCQHLAAHRPDILLACYRAIDQTLGYLQVVYHPQVTLVVSDHGLKPLRPGHPDPRLKLLPGGGACIPLENRKSIWTGEHDPWAYYALSGPGVKAGARLDIDFLQIFPLLLDRLSIPMPAGIAGQPPSLGGPPT